MKPEVKFKYQLSAEDVEKAARNYINENGGVVGGGKVTVIPRFVTQHEPCQYPSDSFQISVFDGLDVQVSEDNDT